MSLIDKIKSYFSKQDHTEVMKNISGFTPTAVYIDEKVTATIIYKAMIEAVENNHEN